MAILNTTVVETVIQNKIDNLTTASSVAEIVLPITASNLNIGLTSSVATRNDLPDITTSGILDGHVIFVRDIGMHVVASQNQWLSFDGRVFKYPTGSSPLPLWSWGSNIYGQLGNNSIVNKSSPVSIAGGFTDWRQVSSGRTHTASIRTNGTLWAWGNNKYGQLGNNDAIIVRSSPVSVVGGFTDWCQVEAGGSHTIAIRTTGTLWSWGINTAGQLGDNTGVNKSSPVQILDQKSVSAGNVHSAAIVDNTLWTWGSNIYGQLGNNSTVNQRSPVSVVGGFVDWCQVSSGHSHTTAIRTNGTLWAWGCNSLGQLGDNTTVNRSSPVIVIGGFTDWCHVSAGYKHTVAMRANCALWVWGCNNVGQLGDNSVVSRSSPVSVVGGFLDWCQFAAGWFHNAAIRTNGSLWTWGSGTSGQLGNNSALNRSSPVSVVGGFTNWCQVSAGRCLTAALRTNCSLWTWGFNSSGQLGDNTNVSKSSPVSVIGGIIDWCRVSSGGSNILALRTNGTLWAWGANNFGRLGDNTNVSRSSPVSVVGGFSNWCSISAAYHNIAINTAGNIWAWGRNYEGQLGDDTVTTKLSPVAVVPICFTWSNITSGRYHNAAVKSNGTLWAWGAGSLGRLGNNSIYGRSRPVQVAGGFTNWCKVSAGRYHTAAVRTNGTIWTWGYNSVGQLGDNTATYRISPVSVVGGFTNWCQISAGNYHTAAVRTNGTLWAWGYNGQGRLGDNTIVRRSSPVSVIGGFTDWCQVDVGFNHTAAVRTNGTLWTWGSGCAGQLGDTTIVNKSSPVSVVGGFTNWCQVSAGGYHTAAIRINT